jgi:hypothetical protein
MYNQIEKIKKHIEDAWKLGGVNQLCRDAEWAIAELERVNKLLHDITPGGSEFYNDPDRCIENIKEQIEVSRRIAKQTIRNSRLKQENSKEPHA